MSSFRTTITHLQAYLMALSLAGIIADATGQNAELQFRYTITGQGTENAVLFPEQKFNYTVIGAGKETWTEIVDGKDSIRISAHSSGYQNKHEEKMFVPSRTGTATATYHVQGDIGSLSRNGGQSSVSVSIGGKTLCWGHSPAGDNDTKSGSCKFEVAAGQAYQVEANSWGEADASISVSFPIREPKSNSADRTARETRVGSVSAADGDKVIGPVGVNAFPRAEKGGVISEVTYIIQNNNDRVVTWVDGTTVLARTSYSEVETRPWSSQQSGSGAVRMGGSEKLVLESNLEAPNGDTRWAVTDDNPAVETWMVGKQLYARPIVEGIRAERTLPAGYIPGATLTVRISVQPNPQTVSYLVEDQPPVGWTVSNVSDGGAFDSVNNRIKFGPFFDSQTRNLTYEATPPANESEPKTIVGLVSADGINVVIIGDSIMSPMQVHPADNNPSDFVMSAAELTAYAAAWKRGQTWSAGPNPIPADYLSRAALLWKRGERYAVDASVPTGPPLWWINVAAAGVLSLVH